MKQNMGTADRIIRAVAGIVIGALLLTGSFGGALAIVLGIVAVLLLGTSAVGFCPAYLPLNLSTRKKASA